MKSARVKSTKASTLELCELLTGHPVGDADALLYAGDRQLSAQEARNSAGLVSVDLGEAGVGEGDLVVIDTLDEVEVVKGVFGVWGARGAMAIIDEDWTDEDRWQLREKLRPKAWWGREGLELLDYPDSSGSAKIPGVAYVEWRGPVADPVVHWSEGLAELIQAGPLASRHGEYDDGDDGVAGFDRPYAIGSRLSCHHGLITLLRAFLEARSVQLLD